MKILSLSTMAGILFTSLCFGQNSLEPITGFRLSLNNKGTKFQQLNTGLQYAIHQNNFYEMLLKAIFSLPAATVRGTNYAYTLNPTLSLSAEADKTIKPYSFSVALGHRFTIAGAKNPDKLNFLIYTGFINEKIVVTYNYDKQNYVILNPDKTQERFNLFISGGVEYMHQFAKGRFLLQVTAATPPFGKDIPYPSTFTFIAPLSIHAGYSIPFPKHSKKHSRK